MFVRLWRNWEWLYGLVIVCALLPVSISMGNAQEQPTNERHFVDYLIRITGGQDAGEKGRLEILQNGRPVYDANDFGYAFVDEPPIGADLFGTGEPVLAIDAYSGGAHCCHQ